MRTVFAGVLGLLAGIGLGVFTVNTRLNATGADTMQASGFNITWVVVAFFFAAVFFAVAAKLRSRGSLFMATALLGMGLVWALS